MTVDRLGTQLAYDSSLVSAHLLEAGRTLYALYVPGCWPAKIRSNAPDYVQVFEESYGWQDAEVRPAVPNAREIARMDQVLSWVRLIPPDRVVFRRLVLSRMVCHPDRDRPVMSWPQLAQKFGASVRSIQYWHAQAIDMMVDALNRPGFCAASGGLVGPSRGVIDRDIARVSAVPLARRRRRVSELV